MDNSRLDNRKSIGVLGGMGPDASVQLCKLIIEKSRRQFGVRANHQYPGVVLHSVPVPDFVDSEGGIPMVLPRLKLALKLMGPSCSSIGIACNTAHIMLPQLKSATKTPITSMIEATANSIDVTKIRTVGLLATPTTLKSGLHQSALAKRGLKVVVPNCRQTKELGKIVQSILAGDFTNSPRRLTQIADALVERGAQAIILGCTELPLVFPKRFRVMTISSLDALADQLLANFFGGA